MSMTATKPNVNPAGRYSIAETSKALGINRSTLRRWTMAGTIRQQRRKATGKPFYTGLEILRIFNETIF